MWCESLHSYLHAARDTCLPLFMSFTCTTSSVTVKYSWGIISDLAIVEAEHNVWEMTFPNLWMCHKELQFSTSVSNLRWALIHVCEDFLTGYMIASASFRHTNNCFQTILDESQHASFMWNLQNKSMLGRREDFERISLRSRSRAHEPSLRWENVGQPQKSRPWLVRMGSWQPQFAGPPSRPCCVCVVALWIWNIDVWASHMSPWDSQKKWLSMPVPVARLWDTESSRHFRGL